MNKRELEDAIEKEVAHWPGVTVEFTNGGKHPKAKFWFDGNMLARPYPGTPSDSAFGLHNCLGDMRRVMKQLGATRDKPEPSQEEDEAPYRKPNDGADAREHHTPGEQAKPKRSVSDQLVATGVATEEQALSAAAAPQPPAADTEAVAAVPSKVKARDSAAAIVDGIYFDLPMEVYLAVPRLGASDLQDLNVSPGTFWRGSWLDPDEDGDDDEPDEKQKKWQLVGEAYHCARLEPDQFEVRFCREPCKADFAEQVRAHGACWNSAEIGIALADYGETKKRAAESVGEQGLRLEDCGYQGLIWPLEKVRFEQGLNGRKPLPGKIWDEVVRDMERFRSNPDLAKLFAEGFAEVSVFYVDANNIPRKARFDWLALDHWNELKTYDNSRRKRVEQAIADAIRYNRYYVTAASYKDASEAIRTGGLQVQGEATDAQRALVARLQMKPDEQRCWFIFQEKGGVPNLFAYEFEFYGVPSDIENIWDTGASEEAQARGHAATRRPTQIYQKGRGEIDYAKRLFVHYANVYGPGEPWAPIEPIGKISDVMFNQYWLEGRNE